MATTTAQEIRRRTRFTGTRTPYVRRGEQLIRSGQDRIQDPDFALSRDPEFWLKIDGNATIRGARDFRKHLVAGPRITLEAKTPLQKALLPYADALIGEIRAFATARLGFADSPFRGHIVGRMHGHWEKRDILGDGTKRRWYILDKVKIQPKGRWELKRWREEDGSQRFGWAIWNFGQGL